MLTANYQRNQKIVRCWRYFMESEHNVTTKRTERYKCVTYLL